MAARGSSPRANSIPIVAPACYGGSLSLMPLRNLELEQGPKVRHPLPALDRRLAMAARIFGARDLGVVLSGGDNDRTNGLIAIGDARGIPIVQIPRGGAIPKCLLAPCGLIIRTTSSMWIRACRVCSAHALNRQRRQVLIAGPRGTGGCGLPQAYEPPLDGRYWLAPADLSLAAVVGAATAGPLCAAALAAAAPPA
ncbi:chemotaxis protein CheB [Paraburkholderia fungorum]|uniref:chemotaxis protein CheB n=1 Tax=Paraburkholderia fungorum TaxID=134537 RepID=UPI0038B73176